MRLPALLLCLGAAIAWDDIDIVCDEGYKVSEISREKGKGDKVGGMEVVCDEIDGDVEDVSCDTDNKEPLVCRGSSENCGKNKWIGGIRGIELDRNTGAVLLQPVCCKSPSVKTKRCKTGKKFNKKGEAFKSKFRGNEAMSGMKCWRMYSRDKT